MNTTNSDDFTGNSNLPYINVLTKSSLNKLITPQKETETQSSISINGEITDDNNTSEEISCHKDSAKAMDHTCDDNGNNGINIGEEADVTYIHSINATNDISTNDDDNCMHKYYSLFLPSKNHEDVSSVSEYDSEKRRLFNNPLHLILLERPPCPHSILIIGWLFPIPEYRLQGH